MTAAPAETISIVVPCFNEAASLLELASRIGQVMADVNASYHLVLVDDGSHDDTWVTIRRLAAAYPTVKAIRLSRNFGKETAILAGLDAAGGDAVVLIDGDLQHPPELIADFVRLWRQGHQVVYGARRDRADGHGQPSIRWFYRLFNALSDIRVSDDAGDFRLMSRRVVDVIMRLRERTRFTKGIFAWIGFDGVAVPYDVGPRRHGVTSFTPSRLIGFAFQGLVSFSTAPLKLGIIVGAVAALGALGLGAFYVFRTMMIGVDVPGYASIIVSVLALGGLTLLQLGLMGLYLGRIYEEVKGRPSYIVRDEIGPATQPSTRDVDRR